MYLKATWQDGDSITANKMNHIENGIADNQPPEVALSDEGYYLQVVADYDDTEEITVVPQQTVTITDSPVKLNTDVGSINGNYIVSEDSTFTVNNSTFACGGYPDYIYSWADSAPYPYIEYLQQPSEGWYFGVTDDNWSIVAGTYTVEVVVTLPKAKWGLGSSPSSGGGLA